VKDRGLLMGDTGGGEGKILIMREKKNKLKRGMLRKVNRPVRLGQLVDSDLTGGAQQRGTVGKTRRDGGKPTI